MISFEEVYKKALEHPLKFVDEPVSLLESVGRILA